MQSTKIAISTDLPTIAQRININLLGHKIYIF